MVTEKITKTSENITYSLEGMTREDFEKDELKYIFKHCYENNGMRIEYEITLKETAVRCRYEFSSKKTFYFLSMPKLQNKIIIQVKRRSSKLSTDGVRSFVGKHIDKYYSYTFKLTEIENGAFNVVSKKKVSKVKTTQNKKSKLKSKKERMTSKMKRQKWIIDHPYQGGRFSPR